MTPKFLVTLLSVGMSMIWSAGCSQQRSDSESMEYEFTNHLAEESSPYLLQHAHNPVDWHPWGQEALMKAQEEKKLIIISIGYSACHWCHVMERESYEDTTVARLMNDHFVSIKIDREERPDIDQVYIEAAQMLNNGRAGWPLNVVALPDATPVFAGTYFKKEQWLQILNQIQNIYEDNPDRLANEAEKIMTGLKTMSEANYGNGELLTDSQIKSAINIWKSRMDRKNGGLQSNQKFPLPGSLEQLMTFGYLSEDQEALDLVELTLDNIAMGGIYDHVGGGFHRYTVEPTWQIPHFEKMLYDNAQLVSLFSKAYQVFGKELYKDAATGTLDFILREMTSSEGGFYSSYDADSEEEEGKFYVWTLQEIQDGVADDAEPLIEYFSIEEGGNWEDKKNILFMREDPYQYFPTADERESINKDLARLFEIRENRIKPALDDKILTSWNALMIRGFIDAYNVFGNEKYLEAAKVAGHFVIDKQMDDDGRLNRNYKDGTSAINAFLDDYAFTIRAFLELYQSTFDLAWLEQAEKLNQYLVTHFYDEEKQLFHYKSDLDEELIIKKYVVDDNVIPSGNSVMTYNLFVMGNLFYDTSQSYRDMSKAMLSSVTENFRSAPYYYYGWIPAFQFQNSGIFEIAIVGNNYASVLGSFREQYFPNAVFLGGNDDTALPLLENKFVEGETFIYVCRDKYCKLPVKEIQAAIDQMD